MNRVKKERLRKYREARQELTPDQIVDLDKREAMEAKTNSLAQHIHRKRFSEESDFYYDSISESNDRSSGKNPMCKEYIEQVNRRRAQFGVDPLNDAGYPTSDQSFKLCRKDAERIISLGKEKEFLAMFDSTYPCVQLLKAKTIDDLFFWSDPVNR